MLLAYSIYLFMYKKLYIIPLILVLTPMIINSLFNDNYSLISLCVYVAAYSMLFLSKKNVPPFKVIDKNPISSNSKNIMTKEWRNCVPII